MTNPDADFRQSLVAAVQAELQRHASAVVAEVDRLRQEGADEQAALRKEMQGQIAALAKVVDQLREQSHTELERSRAAFEARVLESESRQTRRLEDMTAGIEGTVQAAARPLLMDVKADHERMGTKVDALETQLRKFDEQAARMVTYFNDTTQKVEQRQADHAAALSADVQSRLDALARLVDDNESNVRRFQNDVNQVVSNRLNDAEDRFNTRLMAAESRMKEDAGAKIAEIQAHVGRVNANIDDTMAVLNNRLESVDDRFLQSDRRFDELEESVKGIDQNALDELTNKMSAAVGEAMLVRIEVERFQKEVNERTDTLSVRMTDVETQLQDAVMDVSTAVQLDRLEEIERSLAEIDPTKFVLKDPSADDDDDALDEMPSGESEAPLIDFAHFGEPQEPLRNSSHAAEEASRAFPAPAPPPPSV